MLNNVRIIPQNLNEKFRDMWSCSLLNVMFEPKIYFYIAIPPPFDRD